MQPLKYMKQVVTANELNLRNTLLNGQCFNWKVKSITNEEVFYGVIKKSFLLLKQNKDNEIEFEFRQLNKSQIPNVQAFLEEYFQLDIQIGKELKRLKTELNKDLSSVLDSYQGIRVLKQDTLECLISFICSSNNNIERIIKMVDSLKQRLGDLVYSDCQFGKVFSFPDLDKLAVLKESELREMGFGYRANYIVQSVGYLTKNVSFIDDLAKCKNPREELMKLKGIGRKVADCICLFSLGFHGLVPLDVHMINFYNESIVPLNEEYKKIKNINMSNTDLIQSRYTAILGEYAGWIHSVYYMNRIAKKNKYEKNSNPQEENILKSSPKKPIRKNIDKSGKPNKSKKPKNK